MLDKNPEYNSDNFFVKLQKQFLKKNPNIILCSEPFTKSEFLNKIIDSYNIPIIFLDFDLLYSGYVNSGLITKNKNVKIIRSNSIDFEEHVKEIIEMVSKEQTIVILDSFNGIQNMFDEFDSFRFINSIIMLMSTVARQTKSRILISAMAIKNDSGEWVLSPGGKRFINSKNSGIYYINISNSDFILNSINVT